MKTFTNKNYNNISLRPQWLNKINWRNGCNTFLYNNNNIEFIDYNKDTSGFYSTPYYNQHTEIVKQKLEFIKPPLNANISASNYLNKTVLPSQFTSHFTSQFGDSNYYDNAYDNDNNINNINNELEELIKLDNLTQKQFDDDEIAISMNSKPKTRLATVKLMTDSQFKVLTKADMLSNIKIQQTQNKNIKQNNKKYVCDDNCDVNSNSSDDDNIDNIFNSKKTNNDDDNKYYDSKDYNYKDYKDYN